MYPPGNDCRLGIRGKRQASSELDSRLILSLPSVKLIGREKKQGSPSDGPCIRWALGVLPLLLRPHDALKIAYVTIVDMDTLNRTDSFLP